MGSAPTNSCSLASYSKPHPHSGLSALGTLEEGLNPVAYLSSPTAMYPTSENHGQQHSALGAGPVPPHTRVPHQHQGSQQPGSLEFQVEGVVQLQEVWPSTQRTSSGPGHPIYL